MLLLKPDIHSDIGLADALHALPLSDHILYVCPTVKIQFPGKMKFSPSRYGDAMANC